MKLDFYPIQGGEPCVVDLHVDRYDAGAQGRVYRATVSNNVGYCVKALPDFSPGKAAREIAALSSLISHISRSASKPALPLRVRTALRAVISNLPTHTCLGLLDDKPYLLILKRFCKGNSLQSLTVPSLALPSASTRFEIARRLAGSLTSLQINGCVHLDPYPDNIFVDFDLSGKVADVALIDLEGMGLVARDALGNVGKHQDNFAKEPGSYGKPGVWILPQWYPRPPPDTRVCARPFADMYVAASHWQMLSIVIFVLTWGFKPLAWLERSSFQFIARATLDTSISTSQINSALTRRDADTLDDFRARLDGDDSLLEQFIMWTESGLLDPLSAPSAKQIQDSLAEIGRRW